MLSFASHDLGLEFQASFFTLLFYSSKVKVKFVQLCPTLCHPMDCSPSGSSIYGILQAKILKWVAISSLLYANRVVSSIHLRLLIFLPSILISACASSSPAFHRMDITYKLNKQGDNIHTWRTPFPIWNQSLVPCLDLTVASWPEYRLFRRQFTTGWSS